MLTFAKSQKLGILSSSSTVASSSTHWMGGSPTTITRRAFSTWLGAASAVETTNSASFLLAKDFVTHPMTQTIGIMAAYVVTANLIYLARRGYLRNMTLRQLWKIRTTREEGVSPPLFGGMLLAWQFLVLIFPVAEPLARILTKGCIFFYSYPKAQGGGYIWEPLDCQHLSANQRAKQQVRLDWHNFAYNTGPAGRDGYRHPPAMHRNLPHVDIPKWQVKHWPWRRRESVVVRSGSSQNK